MTDRITNADVERMLREMSPAAKRYANRIARTLTVVREDEHTALWVARTLGMLFASESFSGEELRRALDVQKAAMGLLHVRYEIRDRWGQRC